MDALVDLWRSQGALTAFTRFHPLLENVRWAMGRRPGAPGSEPILELGETVAIALRKDDVAAVAAYSETLRQEIARARRAGMVTRLDEDWSGLDTSRNCIEQRCSELAPQTRTSSRRKTSVV